jgi:hypothetical protein
MINTTKYTVALSLLSISIWSASSPAYGQTGRRPQRGGDPPISMLGDHNYAIKTSDGYTIVWNEDGIHFQLDLRGKDVRQMEQPPGSGTIPFRADGIVFQVTSAPISEFAKNARRQKLSDQAILAAYLNWERRYHEQELGAKLTVTSTPQQLASGTQVLLWKLDIPKDKATNQLYCTTVCGSQVIILAGVIDGKTTEAKVQKLLLDTMSTLKVSSRPINLDPTVIVVKDRGKN